MIYGRRSLVLAAGVRTNRHRAERIGIGHGIGRANRCNDLHQERDQAENQAKCKTPQPKPPLATITNMRVVK